MRILFIGDVVGKTGRAAVLEHLPGLIRDWTLDLVVVNGENAAGGFGITEAIYNDFIDAGADAVTLGNHAWNQKEALVFIERAPRLVRPLNFPRHTPGRGAALVETKRGARALIINAMGRVFMEPLDDPFAAVGRELDACPLREAADAIVVDIHCEASSEKQGMGFFCDGRVSLVVGTHTHVPTADHQILSGGTAYMTDAGMTGDYDSVIGMHKDEPLHRFVTGIPSGRFEPAGGVATLSGVAVETDDATGLAQAHRAGADRGQAGAGNAGVLVIRHCERSEAIQCSARKLDCFVASLAMTLATSRHPRSRALARRLEGWPRAPRLLPSFETRPRGSLLRMRAVLEPTTPPGALRPHPHSTPARGRERRECAAVHREFRKVLVKSDRPNPATPASARSRSRA